MRKLDFTLQTLLFIGAIAGLVFISYGGWVLILLIQIVLGILQLLGAFLSWLHKDELTYNVRESLVWYFVAIAFYAALVAGVLIAAPENGAHKLWLFLPPWPIAIFYYSLTCSMTFKEKKRGKFLPNISF